MNFAQRCCLRRAALPLASSRVAASNGMISGAVAKWLGGVAASSGMMSGVSAKLLGGLVRTQVPKMNTRFCPNVLGRNWRS